MSYQETLAYKNWNSNIEAESCDVSNLLIIWVDDGVRKKHRKECEKPMQYNYP